MHIQQESKTEARKNKPCLHAKGVLFALQRSLVCDVTEPCLQFRQNGADLEWCVPCL